MSATTTAVAFKKAVLQDPEQERGFHPSRGSVVVGTPEYDALVRRGFTVVETWNVWLCQVCGNYDSDRDHAAWEESHFGPISHLDRYGHESVRPIVVQDECTGCGAELPSTELHYDLEGYPRCPACQAAVS